jgi:hypothetical protein
MSVSGSQFTDITAVASTGLTGNQYYFVRSTGVDSTYSGGNLTCLLCTSATGNASAAKGVLQNDPDTGEAAIVRVDGVTKLVAGGTIAVGNLVTSSTAGTGIACTTTGEFYLGRAESASTAAGQIISVRLAGPGVWMGSTA